jgi:hypothetical protein
VIVGNLTVTGSTEYINVATVAIQDPIISVGRGANNAALSSNDNKDRGEQLYYYDTQERSAFIGYIASTGKLVAATRASITSEVVTINTYGSFVVGQLEGTTVSVSGTVTCGNVSTTGTVSATGTITGGNLTTVGSVGATGGITGGNLLTGGNVSATGTVIGGVITSVGNVTGGNLLTGGNVSATGTVIGGVITSVGNVTGANINGNGSGLSSLTGANVTGTVANATFATSAGSATSATTAGTVTTAAQPNITSVGTLSSVTVTANVTGGNINTGGRVSATGNLVAGANVLVSGAFVQIPVASSNPSNPVTGALYYNSSFLTLRLWNGSFWTDV